MISFAQVTKTFAQGGREVVAVSDLTLDIASGEFLAVVGPSGSGKSTLLHLAGGLDLPTAGRVEVAGVATSHMSDDELTGLRRRRIGFVFQFFNLLPALTVEENVALPLLLDGARLPTVRDRVRAMIDAVELTARREHRPAELSGGEMQRAAIARALVTDPEIVLADEPTGNLDSRTGEEVLRLLRALTAEGGRSRTVVLVTHDPAAAARGDRRVTLRDGRLVS
jgi:putative ABC transport system ATP-binding protein